MGGSFTIKRQQDITSDLIRYLLGNTQHITDYSEGSIVRSLCEAISQEIYFSNLGFAQGIFESINTSVKEVFDQPLLQPQKASGLYTFYRSMLSSPVELASVQMATSNDDGTQQYFTYGLLPQGSTLYYGVSGYKKRLSGSDRDTKFETVASPYKIVVPTATQNSFTKGAPAILKWIWSPDFEGYYIYRSSVNPVLLTDIKNAAPTEISYAHYDTNGMYGTFWFSVCGIDASGKMSIASVPTKKQLVGQSTEITANSATAPNAASFKFFRNIIGAPYSDRMSVVEAGGVGATFNVTTNGSGAITGVSINNRGTRYSAGDTIIIDGPGNPTQQNRQRVVVATVNSIGQILTFTPTSSFSGSGYTASQVSVSSSSTLEEGFSSSTRVNYSVASVDSSGNTSPATSIVTKLLSSPGSVKIIFPMVSKARRYDLYEWIGEISTNEASAVNYYSGNKITIKLNPLIAESNQAEKSVFLRPTIDATGGVSRISADTGGMAVGSWSYKVAPLFHVYNATSSQIIGQSIGIVSPAKIFSLAATANALQINFTWDNNFLTTINSQIATPLKGVRLYRKGPSQTNWWFKDFTEVSNLTNISVSVIDRPTSTGFYTASGVDENALSFGWEELSSTSPYYNSIYYSMIDDSSLSDPIAGKKPFPLVEILNTGDFSWQPTPWRSQDNYPMSTSVSTTSSSLSKNIVNWQNVTTETVESCPLVYRIAEIQSASKNNTLSTTVTIGYGTQADEKIGKAQASSSEILNESYFVWADNGRSPVSTVTNWPLINFAQAVEGEIFIPIGTRVSIPNTTNLYETTETKNLSESENEKIVTIKALASGALANTDANTITSILNPVYGIASGTNILPLTSGKNMETEEEWRIRFSKTLRQLSRGTKESIEEGAKQSALIDENGNIIEEIKFSFAFEETSNSVRLYVHNGTSTQVSEDLRKKCQLIINGYEDQGAIYPGYKPAGVPVTVSACLYETINITLQVIVASGYNLSTLLYAIEYVVQTYVNSLDIGNGFDVPVLSLNTALPITASSGDTQSVQYKVVLVDNFYQKGIPSNTLTANGINIINPQEVSVQWTVPTEMGSRISYSEILRWNIAEESWKLIHTKIYDQTDLNSLKYTDDFSSTENLYNFSTMSRNVFQKSSLIQKIMRIPGIAAVSAQVFHGTPATDKEVIVPLTGYVLKIGTLSIR